MHSSESKQDSVGHSLDELEELINRYINENLKIDDAAFETMKSLIAHIKAQDADHAAEYGSSDIEKILGDALTRSVLIGHEENIKLFCALGADVNYSSSTSYKKMSPGICPLSIAAINGNLDVVKLLIQLKANPNTRSYYNKSITPIYYAIHDFVTHKNHFDIVKAILNAGADLSIIDTYLNAKEKKLIRKLLHKQEKIAPPRWGITHFRAEHTFDNDQFFKMKLTNKNYYCEIAIDFIHKSLREDFLKSLSPEETKKLTEHNMKPYNVSLLTLSLYKYDIPGFIQLLEKYLPQANVFEIKQQLYDLLSIKPLLQLLEENIITLEKAVTYASDSARNVSGELLQYCVKKYYDGANIATPDQLLALIENLSPHDVNFMPSRKLGIKLCDDLLATDQTLAEEERAYLMTRRFKYAYEGNVVDEAGKAFASLCHNREESNIAGIAQDKPILPVFAAIAERITQYHEDIVKLEHINLTLRKENARLNKQLEGQVVDETPTMSADFTETKAEIPLTIHLPTPASIALDHDIEQAKNSSDPDALKNLLEDCIKKRIAGKGIATQEQLFKMIDAIPPANPYFVESRKFAIDFCIERCVSSTPLAENDRKNLMWLSFKYAYEANLVEIAVFRFGLLCHNDFDEENIPNIASNMPTLPVLFAIAKKISEYQQTIVDLQKKNLALQEVNSQLQIRLNIVNAPVAQAVISIPENKVEDVHGIYAGPLRSEWDFSSLSTQHENTRANEEEKRENKEYAKFFSSSGQEEKPPVPLPQGNLGKTVTAANDVTSPASPVSQTRKTS